MGRFLSKQTHSPSARFICKIPKNFKSSTAHDPPGPNRTRCVCTQFNSDLQKSQGMSRHVAEDRYSHRPLYRFNFYCVDWIYRVSYFCLYFHFECVIFFGYFFAVYGVKNASFGRCATRVECMLKGLN